METVYVPDEVAYAVCELYSFPFMILVDPRQQISTHVVKIEHTYIRFYPPFRSGDANYVPMPAIRVSSIPFRRGYEPERLPPASETLPVLAILPGPAVPGVQDVSTQLVWGPTWKDEPMYFPADSLRIDVYTEEGNSPADTEAITRSLLAHLRESTRQWWLLRSFDTVLGWHRNSCTIDRQGRFKKPQDTETYAQSSLSMLGTELPVTEAIWQEALDSLARQDEVCRYKQFLFDAQCCLASRDYALCAFNLATACELAAMQCADALWERQTGESKSVLTGNDLAKKLDHQLRNRFGVSLKDDDEELFQTIKALWNVRGAVAHGKPACYHDDHGREIHVDHKRSFEMLQATVRCIEWLEKRLQRGESLSNYDIVRSSSATAHHENRR